MAFFHSPGRRAIQFGRPSASSDGSRSIMAVHERWARKQQALWSSESGETSWVRGCHVEACDRWPQADKRMVALALLLQRRSVPDLVRAPNYLAIGGGGEMQCSRQQQPVLSCTLARSIDGKIIAGGVCGHMGAEEKHRQAANLSPSEPDRRSSRFRFRHSCCFLG
jgi:hypothetical protein